MRETVVLHLAELCLLSPSFFVGFLIRRRQHAFANLAFEPWRVDEDVHVRVAGSHPQAVPSRHGRDRVLRATFGSGEEKLVVFVRCGEALRWRHYSERWSVSAAEGSGLRDEIRACAEDDERDGGDGDPAEAPVEIHGNSK